jgi:hypothetical protein
MSRTTTTLCGARLLRCGHPLQRDGQRVSVGARLAVDENPELRACRLIHCSVGLFLDFVDPPA